MDVTMESNIFCFEAPVVLVSTLNKDGTANLAATTSAYWINQSCKLGMCSTSQTVQNILRERECVLNLPAADIAGAVDRLSLLTGRKPVPKPKADLGYRYEPDKFGAAGLSRVPSYVVKPPRAEQCPVQLEAIAEEIHSYEGPSSLAVIQVRVVRIHLDERILAAGDEHYMNPDRWNLIMNFCEFFRLSGKLASSGPLAPSMMTYDEGS